MSDLGNKEVFAKNLNRYVDESGKTRAEICEALGFKYSTFSDWMNGYKYPRIDNIEMLANYFGVKKADLIEEHKEDFVLKNTYFSFAKEMQNRNLSEEDLNTLWEIYDMINKKRK
jgi:transcriptional regulator with XRE-family HTH domain